MMGLVEHLERQLASSRRLLVAVTAQREAIKAQDVETVLARLADIQQEMAGSPDFAEGVRAFAEKRPARFTGA